MIQDQLQLSEEQTQALRRLAEEEGVSLEEMVRRCVVRALDQIPVLRARYERAATIIGAIQDREGASDLASERDRYLTEEDR